SLENLPCPLLYIYRAMRETIHALGSTVHVQRLGLPPLGNRDRPETIHAASMGRIAAHGDPALTLHVRSPPPLRLGGRAISRSRRGSSHNPVDSRTVTPSSGSSFSPAKTNVLPAARPRTSITPKPMGNSCSVPSASSQERRSDGLMPNL